MTKPVIDIKGLKKSYTLGSVTTEILRGIDIQIHEGEFVAIMGPSGAGKSTFMNILGFLDTPTGGTYEFDNKNIKTILEDELAEIRNSKVGFVFQMFNLLPQLSALENVILPLTYANIGETEQMRRGNEALEEVSMGHRALHKPNELSGGEQQRIAIARALINKPKIILADEPTGNLDSKTSDEIMEIFCDLHYNHHHTIIMITHEPDIAEYAERFILLKDGKIEKDVQQTSCFVERFGLINGKKMLNHTH